MPRILKATGPDTLARILLLLEQRDNLAAHLAKVTAHLADLDLQLRQHRPRDIAAARYVRRQG